MLPPAPKDHRRRAPNRAEVAEEMFQALEQTTRQVAFQVSRTASLEALGPFANLMSEFIERQGALEDAFWYCPKCHDTKFFPEPVASVPLCPHCMAEMVQYAYVPKATTGATVASESAEKDGKTPADGDSTTTVSDAPPTASVESSGGAIPQAASDQPFESTAP